MRVERRMGHCPCPPLEGGSVGVSPPLPQAAPGERAEGGEGGQGRIRRVWGPVPVEQGPHGAAGQGLQAPSPHDHPQAGSTGSAGSARRGGGAGVKAEILRLEAENKLLRGKLKAAEAARKTALLLSSSGSTSLAHCFTHSFAHSTKKMEQCFLRAKCARAGEGRNFQ